MEHQRSDRIVDAIIETVEGNRDFVVLAHLNPDGDGIGSLVALGRVLRALGKRGVLLSPGEIPAEYRFLTRPGEVSPRLPSRERWDVVFLLDIPCIARLPASLSGKLPPSKELINIDHHPTNDIQGTLNWVDSKASSVGEMLYGLFDKAGYPIPPEVATPLYAAILTDTGSFRFTNTTPSALTAAAALLERGADAAGIADRVYASHSLREYRLLGEALSTLRRSVSGRGAFMWVTQEMLRRAGASLLETSGFENVPRELKDVDIGILFKEDHEGQTVRVSLRSKRPSVDVSRVARHFGGGGHPTAAGCVITGSRQSVQERVLHTVEEELARGNSASRDPVASREMTKG